MSCNIGSLSRYKHHRNNIDKLGILNSGKFH